MQPVQRPNKRTAAALLVLATGMAGLTVPVSSALAQTRHGARKPTRTAQADAPVPCMPQNCAITPTSKMSSIHVQPVETPDGTTPSFNIPATANPGVGMLHTGSATGRLSCGGYQGQDQEALQFFISDAFRDTLTYQVTDTVTNAAKKLAKLQFCLGATFKFRTLSGKQAPAVTLPNGLPGHSGLVPPCPAVPNPKQPCLVSKSSKGRDAVLQLLIPAIGDPWGRA